MLLCLCFNAVLFVHDSERYLSVIGLFDFRAMAQITSRRAISDVGL
jgi:hypothetical protein